MKRLLLVGALALTLAGCTDPEGAVKALHHMGIHAEHVGGYAFFGCSDKDTFATKFDGTDAQGNPVSGVVCRGWFKNSTVRFDD